MVPRTGLEPARSLKHWILSPACLPIPASRLFEIIVLYRTYAIVSECFVIPKTKLV
jgi:hypothetical protein